MNQRLISFKIDPSLDKLWTAMGLTQVEKAEESKKLEQELLKAYQNFIAETTSNCDDLRAELREALLEYQHVQIVFGDNSPQPILNPKTSLRDQVNEVYEMIDEIKYKYQDRIQEFDEIYETLQEQYHILRVSEENQGEFAQVGEEDLTKERLDRFRQMAKNLDHELDQRTKLFDTLATDLTAILNDVQEFPSDKVQEILDEKYIDNESITLLKDTVRKYKNMKENNMEQIQELWTKIEHLYDLLDIKEKDQIQKPQNPSVEAVDTLNLEIQNLQEQADERVPIVAKQLNQQIKDICEDLRMPKKMRPKYTGSNQEEEVLYLKRELKKLQETQIKTQPIIDIISELETLKNTQTQDSKQNSSLSQTKEKGTSRRLTAEEKNRKIAREKIPQLEQKLLKLLVQYREENGYDFEFDGIDINSIGTSESGNSSINSLSPYGQLRQQQDMAMLSQKQSLGKALLLQKLNSSSNKIQPTDEKKSKQNIRKSSTSRRPTTTSTKRSYY